MKKNTYEKYKFPKLNTMINPCAAGVVYNMVSDQIKYHRNLQNS